jgi:hypothetical protein
VIVTASPLTTGMTSSAAIRIGVSQRSNSR